MLENRIIQTLCICVGARDLGVSKILLEKSLDHVCIV